MEVSYGIYDDYRLDYNTNHGKDGKFAKGNSSYKNNEEHTPIKMSKAEYAKVTSEINNKWHAQYKGEENCIHTTWDDNDVLCVYRFENNGFNNYLFYDKMTADE